MITQLNPPIPIDTPQGKAMAHFVIDEGTEHSLRWVTFVEATGECVTWTNPQIRAQRERNAAVEMARGPRLAVHRGINDNPTLI